MPHWLLKFDLGGLYLRPYLSFFTMRRFIFEAYDLFINTPCPFHGICQKVQLHVLSGVYADRFIINFCLLVSAFDMMAGCFIILVKFLAENVSDPATELRCFYRLRNPFLLVSNTSISTRRFCEFRHG